MKKFIAATALCTLVAAGSLPAHAAANVALAVPGSFAAGYATPRVVFNRAAPSTLVNLDAEPHDIHSVKTRLVGSVYKFLFDTPVIGTGETVTITFLPNVAPGDYAFVCAVHSNMMGTATVQ